MRDAFADVAFGLGISNSGIEHVDSAKNEFKFASEMMRVGKADLPGAGRDYFPLIRIFPTLSFSAFPLPG